MVVDSQGRKVELKDLFQTTYDRDFAPKELPKRSQNVVLEEEPYVPMKDDRDFLSTTQREYRPWKIEPRRIPEQEEIKRETIPFAATTTNQDTYKAYKIEPKQHAMDDAAPAIPESLPFTATTTNSDTYRKWSIPKKTYISLVPANDAFISRDTGETVGDYLDVVGEDIEEEEEEDEEKATEEALVVA